MATTAAAYRCRSRPSGPPVARLLPASPSPPPPPSPGRRLPMRSVIATSPVGLSSAVPKLVCSPCRLRVSYRRRGLYVSACSGEVDSDAAESPAEATFEIKLPRRSLLVQFTCNKCGERTKRLINRVAYERGTVFLQCAGCQVYHKIVDNLGLVVEYDLREENGVNTYTED